MIFSKNICLISDSYKYSMFSQYPPGTETVYSYIESRGGKWDKTVFFGLQGFIKEYLLEPVTKDQVDFAEYIITRHGEPFYREGWDYILKHHNGYLPIEIKAVPEGLVIPNRNVLLTIENTDTKCGWLTTFLETPLLRAIWYPTEVCTNSWESKKIITRWKEKNGNPDDIDFSLHDFGARGVSSLESAGIGGAAHLVNFKGTDNVSGLMYAYQYYNAGVAGFSVPAMEHSTVTAWGRENEIEAYRNMIRNNPNKTISIVSDSYNIFEACKAFGTVLKQDIIDNNVKLVVRPDSGRPSTIVSYCLNILSEHFGYTINDKGYKVLNNVKVLQGDGIDHASIEEILYTADIYGFSSDNLLFGQGGALLQVLDRDTMKFAMKAAAACINGEWRDVYKDPITDNGKSSKRGRVTLYNENGKYYSGVEDWNVPVLQTIYRNGKLLKEYTFEEIRQNSKSS